MLHVITALLGVICLFLSGAIASTTVLREQLWRRDRKPAVERLAGAAPAEDAVLRRFIARSDANRARAFVVATVVRRPVSPQEQEETDPLAEFTAAPRSNQWLFPALETESPQWSRWRPPVLRLPARRST